MQHFHQILAALAVPALLTASMPAEARAPKQPEWDIHKMFRSWAPQSNILGEQRLNSVKALNQRLDQRLNSVNALNQLKVSEDYTQPEPAISVGPHDILYDMDGPNGEIWYYAQSYNFQTIEYNEYYTDYVMLTYTIDIYDSKMQHVGQIFDKVRYLEDEVRVAGTTTGFDVLPVITQKHFNKDDNYEVIVSLTCNTTTPGNNRTRTLVYSIGGPQETLSVLNPETGTEEEKSCDTPVFSMDGLICDVRNNSTNGKEEIYLSFYTGNGSTTYGQMDESTGKLTKLLDFDVAILQMQGDQMDTTPFMLSLTNEYGCFLVCPKYTETFYHDDPDSTEEIPDWLMTDPNELEISVYKLEPTKATLVQTTKIPVTLDTQSSTGKALYTYYAVGNLRYGADVIFDKYAEDGSLSFVITRFNYDASTDGLNDFCYYVYDKEGNKVKTIFERAMDSMSVSDLEGHASQHCFITYEGMYVFNFMNLDSESSAKAACVIEQYVDTGYDEPEPMMANFDRVLQKDGSYKYAFEMRYPTTDLDDNTFMRIAWFSQKGKLERIDEVNMGNLINYGTVYLTNQALQPDLFDDDEDNEYMVLIKRALSEESTASQEELIIGKPAKEENDWMGSNLLHLLPSDKGKLSLVGLYPLDGKTSLLVTYIGSKGYYVDFYSLPFLTSAVTEIGADDSVKGDLRFDGTSVYGEGEIRIYDLQGVEQLRGTGKVDVSRLGAGTYVAASEKGAAKIQTTKQ